MAKFTPSPNLEQIVARIVRPQVQRVIERVAEIAKQEAPPTKTWVSMRDSRVRETHVRADGQEVPANLRFTVSSMEWDRQHRGVGPNTYMIVPRDESSHAFVNCVNCRCRAEVDDDGVAKLVDIEDARLVGTVVHGSVYAEGNLVTQAEYGDVYPGGLVAEGTFFMHRAAAIAQAAR